MKVVDNKVDKNLIVEATSLVIVQPKSKTDEGNTP